ncbi:MAG: OmpA family protein [bacterium]
MMRISFRSVILAIAAWPVAVGIMLTGSSAPAATACNLAGNWDLVDSASAGSNFPGAFTVSPAAPGGFQWTWVSGWKGTGTIKGSAVTLDGGGSGYVAHWDGTIDQACSRVTGRWKQSDGQTGTFTLKRATAAVLQEQGRLRVVVESSVLFDFDRYDLKPSSAETLAEVKRTVIDKYPGAHLLIEGYTDDQGAQEYNLKLSTERAQAVAAWLRAHGVSATLLQTHGYGKLKPRYPNTNDDNRARNRRVEIVIAK